MCVMQQGQHLNCLMRFVAFLDVMLRPEECNSVGDRAGMHTVSMHVGLVACTCAIVSPVSSASSST